MSIKRNEKVIISHLQQCPYLLKIKSGDLLENRDYVVCKLCNFHAQNLGIHLKKIHKIESIDYCNRYNCSSLSENSCLIYKHARKNKFGEHNSYADYAKAKGLDLTEYKKRISDSTSRTILLNNEECLKRSLRMKKLVEKQNKDPRILKIRSETAKLTSARPEIQKQRAERLKKWRDNNPEAFYQKCIKRLITTFNSKPERKLFQFVSTIENFSFKRNQFVISKTFLNKTGRKQIDIGDKKKRVYIEYDGVFHFLPKISKESLEINRNKDKLLEEYIIKHGWTLIRVSYDQYVDKNKIEKSFFKSECLDKLVKILKDSTPGIYKIGEAYDQYKKY